MATNSTIEWTEATWNPVGGCTVVSPGCTNCYAMRLASRLALQLLFCFEVCALSNGLALRQSDHAMMCAGWMRFRASLMAMRRISWIDQQINEGVAMLLFLP